MSRARGGGGRRAGPSDAYRPHDSVTTVTSQEGTETAVDTDRAFLRLWAAESVSKTGDAIGLVAVPLTAIVALDASPIELGLLGAAQLVPIVLLGLPAGAWVDRLRSRRRVMVAADLARGACLASVPLAWLGGWLGLEHLILVVAVNAALGTFFDVAIAAYVPALVGRNRLLWANARLELSRSASLVLGPGLAGVALRVLAAPIALAIDALSFVASAGLVASSPDAEPLRARSPNREPRPLRRELFAGVGLVVREPHLRAITLTAMTNNVSRSIGMVVAMLYLVRGAGLSADAVGLALALGNSGFIVGAVLASRLSAALGVGRAMRLGVGVFWPGMLLFGLVPIALAPVAFTVMVFLNGFGIAVHNVNQVSVRQAVTPDHLRARVSAATRLLIMGALPAGTLIGGILGSLIGFQATLVVSAVGLFLGSVPYAVSPVRVLRSLPAEVAA